MSVLLDGVSWWPGMEDTAECCQDARPEPNWSSSLINLHNTHRQHSRHAADTDCHYGDLIHALILRILLLSCANHVVDMIHYESMWYDFSGGKEIEIFLCCPFQFNMECGGLTLLAALSWSGPTPWPVSCLHLNPDTDGSCVQSRSQ